MLTAIGELFPVEFETFDEGQISRHYEGVIVLNGDRAAVAAARTAQIPALLIELGTRTSITRRSTTVEFGSQRSLDSCLRSQQLDDSDVESFVPLSPQSDDEIIGQMEGRPFWLRRGTGRTSLDVVALALPALADGDRLLDYFHPDRFVRLLPLLHFMRHRTAAIDWDPVPFRACFVFDDPDLVNLRYGCLDYCELARHARECGYHAAVAMVPLSAGRACPRAVELFRANPTQLSLLIHGNNHTGFELLRCYTDTERKALLAQALRRIEEFERHFRTEVDHVMEPPHGVISRAMFPSLAALGFESAMTTFEKLVKFEPSEPWPMHFGMDMAEVMPGGIATTPRIRMLPNWRTAAVLAGFLRQPIVIAGHHQDAVDGLDFLEEFARLVAGFGPVRWLSPAGIARSNFKMRRRESCLRVKAYQRHICLPIPDGVDQLIMERVWLTRGEHEHLTVESPVGARRFSGNCGRQSQPLPVRSGETIVVRSLFGQLLTPGDIPPPPRSLWPTIRRRMTETRDRCYPWFHRRRNGSSPPARKASQPC
ncbi:MAG: hypothetical protein EXS18_01240 [Verrucomicrobiae bacterium]|nr:hypothetical protein [Verrucomicrobiae bacterium]